MCTHIILWCSHNTRTKSTTGLSSSFPLLLLMDLSLLQNASVGQVNQGLKPHKWGLKISKEHTLLLTDMCIQQDTCHFKYEWSQDPGWVLMQVMEESESSGRDVGHYKSSYRGGNNKQESLSQTPFFQFQLPLPKHCMSWSQTVTFVTLIIAHKLCNVIFI